MELTIAILSIPERLWMLQRLLDVLSSQVSGKPVEVLYIGDNLSRSVGAKRNIALNAAKGRYISFIDDDDIVTPDYVEKLLEAVKTNPDVVTFMVDQEYNGKKERYQVFKNIKARVQDPELRKKLGRPVNTMPPNHLCCWKKSLISVKFPDKSKGEDHVWSELMALRNNKSLKIYEIDKVLYIYRYNSYVTRTQSR